MATKLATAATNRRRCSSRRSRFVRMILPISPPLPLLPTLPLPHSGTPPARRRRQSGCLRSRRQGSQPRRCDVRIDEGESAAAQPRGSSQAHTELPHKRLRRFPCLPACLDRSLQQPDAAQFSGRRALWARWFRSAALRSFLAGCSGATGCAFELTTIQIGRPNARCRRSFGGVTVLTRGNPPMAQRWQHDSAENGLTDCPCETSAQATASQHRVNSGSGRDRQSPVQLSSNESATQPSHAQQYLLKHSRRP